MEQNDAHILPIRTNVSPNLTFVSQLPTPLTSFIGREQEVAEVCHLLQKSTVRLLTLSGPGGVGKTRLCLEAARHVLTYFLDGIFFVPCAPIHDPLLILPHIASNLGIEEQSILSLRAQLIAKLGHTSLLLLLDNFEHLLTAASSLVELLQACPSLKILVTSRAILRVQGEHVFEVLPLTPPRKTHAETIEQFMQYPSVQLFVQRAQALRNDFVLNDENCHAIAEICTRLDGLPLAIELAAARINLLPPHTLLGRLEHRLPLLTTGGHDVHWRQQTLRNTLQWSYDLLNQQEQWLFRTLSVFTGGCTLEEVEAIYYADGREVENLLDMIGSLIDKSFAFRSEQAKGELRIFMLETIREYGLASLEASGEEGYLHQKHAEYFLALAEEAEMKLASAEQIVWLERLEQEHDNLRAALNWLIESKQMELALRLESALSPFWTMHNHISEGHLWLEKALNDRDRVPVPIQAKALSAAGAFSFYRGDNSRAAALFEESLRLFRELGDKRGIVLALNGLGHVSLAQHRYSVIQSVSDENLLLAREMGDLWKTAEALFLSAYGYLAQGDYEKARAASEECLAMNRIFMEPSCIAHAIHTVGLIASKQNDLDVAYSLYQESIARAVKVDDRWLITACLVGLGEVVTGQGKYAWAARLWGAEEALHKTIHARLLYLVRSPDEELVTTTRARLGEEAFTAAWTQGRTMTVEQVLAAQDGMSASEHLHLFSQQDASLAPLSQRTNHLRPEFPDGLTAREVQVLRLIADGLTNTQIAGQLVISPVTVNTHIRSIYNKLGISSRSTATRYVLEHRLIQ